MGKCFRWEKKRFRSFGHLNFLWQEGHTAHIDEEDARQETMQMLTIYKDVVEGLLAIPVYDGQKHLQNALQGQSIHFLLKQ